jgi:multiple sugar transport system permease protein
MAMIARPLLFAGLPPWGRRVLFGLAVGMICFAFAFPVLWLMLTSIRPESGVYYVHRGTEFTLHNFIEVFENTAGESSSTAR